MNLKHLTDTTLHDDTIKLVNKEREVTTEVLHHLKEIDRRKLFSDYKCSSLFDYCVRLLGYCESSAQRRIVAARLLDEMPEIEKKIENGDLTLTNIAQANQFFRENEISKPEEKQDVLKKVEGLTKKDCEKKLFELSGKQIPAKENTKRLSSDTNKVTLILSDETLAEIDHLKALLSKKISMDDLIKFMAQTAIQRVEKRKFKIPEREISLPPEEVAAS